MDALVTGSPVEPVAMRRTKVFWPEPEGAVPVIAGLVVIAGGYCRAGCRRGGHLRGRISTKTLAAMAGRS